MASLLRLSSLSASSSSSRLSSSSSSFVRLQSSLAAEVSPKATAPSSSSFSSSSSSSSPSLSASIREKKEAAPLDFNDAKVAFETRTTLQLIRAWGVFKLSSFPIFVSNSRQLLLLSNRILGERLTSWGLKQTFFGHFCGGETAQEVHPLMDRLRAAGIGSILDYAAEADVSQEQISHKYQKAGEGEGVQSRVYEYDGEEQCDANVAIFLSCIETTGAREEGFAAIKLTALGKPEFLERVSVILIQIRTLFRQFADASPSPSASPAAQHQEEAGSDYEKRISLDQFREGVRQLGVEIQEEHLVTLFHRMDRDGSGFIEYLEWVEYLGFDDETTRPFFTSKYGKDGEEIIPSLSPRERKQLANMIRRLEVIAEEASKKRVRLMIDAEQTYFQPAIDHLAINLQRKYNREFPVIFNTYQAYLKDSYSRVRFDLERARKEDFIFAAKIVRGAYMIQERRRALERNYADPIFPNLQRTHESYDRIIKMVLDSHQRTELMVATHNEESVRLTTAYLANISDTSKHRVFFGQLLGMCDHVSYTLGKHGYGVFKYVPYGPVKEVIPYLIRRAEENSDVLGRALKEREMLLTEIKRRLNPFAR